MILEERVSQNVKRERVFRVNSGQKVKKLRYQK